MSKSFQNHDEMNLLLDGKGADRGATSIVINDTFEITQRLLSKGNVGIEVRVKRGYLKLMPQNVLTVTLEAAKF